MVFLHLHNPPVNHHSAVVWCISFLLPLAQPAMPAAASRKLTRSRESHPCAGLVHYFRTAKLLQNLADMSEANSFNLINLLGTFCVDSAFWHLSTVHRNQKKLEHCVDQQITWKSASVAFWKPKSVKQLNIDSWDYEAVNDQESMCCWLNPIILGCLDDLYSLYGMEPTTYPIKFAMDI